MPDGLVECQKLPEPVFTPSTKAEQGAHDENLHPDVGTSLFSLLSRALVYSHPRFANDPLLYLVHPTSPRTSHTSYLCLARGPR